MQGSHYNDVTLRGGSGFETDFIAAEMAVDAIQSSIRRVDMVCEQVFLSTQDVASGETGSFSF